MAGHARRTRAAACCGGLERAGAWKTAARGRGGTVTAYRWGCAPVLRRCAAPLRHPEGRWLDPPEGRVAWSRTASPGRREVGCASVPTGAWRRCATTSAPHLRHRPAERDRGAHHHALPVRRPALVVALPETERRCAKLVLPNGGRRFLSRAPTAWPTLAARTRSCAAPPRRALHGRLGSDERLACAPAPPRPRGMRGGPTSGWWPAGRGGRRAEQGAPGRGLAHPGLAAG
jgi:hypothetical protein